MQDWLLRHGLSRSTLGNLQENLAAVDEYQVRVWVLLSATVWSLNAGRASSRLESQACSDTQLTAAQRPTCLMQEYVWEEVSECMAGMLDGVEAALSSRSSGGSSAELTRESAPLPAPRWAPQSAARQEAGLEQLSHGPFAAATTDATSSHQRVLASAARLPTEPAEQRHADPLAQPEVEVDTEGRAVLIYSDRSQPQSLAHETAGGMQQRNSQPMAGDSCLQPHSIADAAQQQPEPADKQQPHQFLLPPPSWGQQLHHATQPQPESSSPVEPSGPAQPPIHAATSHALPVGAMGSAGVKAEADMDVQPGLISAPHSPSVTPGDAAKPLLHACEDGSSDAKHSRRLANGYTDQPWQSPAVDPGRSLANGHAAGVDEPKRADGLQNGYLSGWGAAQEARASAASGRSPASAREVVVQPAEPLLTGEDGHTATC